MTTMQKWHALGSAVIGCALWAAPAPADACGGTFCDAGPASMPVDQSGENVLFVIEGGTVEAHIQIQYKGDADAFAWIVPMTAVPTVEPGSDPLFDALLAASVPTVTLMTQFEDCPDRRGSRLGCGMELASDARGSGDDGFFGEGGESGGMPEVVVSGVAGAFEYAVLEGGTVDGVVQWLTDNGYAQDDEAPAVLQQYLEEGFVFVAFKLRGGAGIEEIHPVVLRYQGDEPCVPLRLTRIAALEDMPVRVFFLGQSRVVPTNYRHVLVNPLKLDWMSLGMNYDEVVTMAVDEDGADGHGFVTEYAGTSSMVVTDAVHDPRWNAAPFADAGATEVVELLESQGLFTCEPDPVTFEEGCRPLHPLVPGLLAQYLPVPVGIEPDAFYECLPCFEAQIDLAAWDPAGFSADVQARIVAPAEHALAVLQRPYLTRLFTTISPAEMTEDPLFHESAELPEVDNQLVATRIVACEGNDRIELPDGRTVFLDAGIQPGFEDEPWAEVIEEVPMAGAPIVLADHGDDIDRALDEWNAAHDHDGGCGCRITQLRLEGLLAFALLGLGLWSRRRP